MCWNSHNDFQDEFKKEISQYRSQIQSDHAHGKNYPESGQERFSEVVHEIRKTVAAFHAEPRKHDSDQDQKLESPDEVEEKHQGSGAQKPFLICGRPVDVKSDKRRRKKEKVFGDFMQIPIKSVNCSTDEVHSSGALIRRQAGDVGNDGLLQFQTVGDFFHLVI